MNVANWVANLYVKICLLWSDCSKLTMRRRETRLDWHLKYPSENSSIKVQNLTSKCQAPFESLEPNFPSPRPNTQAKKIPKPRTQALITPWKLFYVFRCSLKHYIRWFSEFKQFFLNFFSFTKTLLKLFLQIFNKIN